MAETKIEHISIRDLKPCTSNARTHSNKHVRQIADGIDQFGFTNPVLIDENGTIIAGHDGLAAAKLIGMRDVPCLRFEHMTEAAKRAYFLADNKLALNAGWDGDLLAARPAPVDLR